MSLISVKRLKPHPRRLAAIVDQQGIPQHISILRLGDPPAPINRVRYYPEVEVKELREVAHARALIRLADHLEAASEPNPRGPALTTYGLEILKDYRTMAERIIKKAGLRPRQ